MRVVGSENLATNRADNPRVINPVSIFSSLFLKGNSFIKMWCTPFTNGGVVARWGRKIMRNVRFSRDGWKVMLVTVTILALILTGMFTLSLKQPAVAKAEVEKTEVEALVKKAALIFANSIPHDKFLSSSASVVELNITDNGIEAIVNTEQTFVLDYNTPYDEPYLKGMMQKLRDDKSISSVEEVSIANEYMKERAAAIQYEMENPSTVYCTYKLIASSLEEAQKGNFTVYIWTNIDRTQNGVIENWIPTDFYSSTDEEMAKKGYEGLDTYVSAVQQAYTEAKQNKIKKESNTTGGIQ